MFNLILFVEMRIDDGINKNERNQKIMTDTNGNIVMPVAPMGGYGNGGGFGFGGDQGAWWLLILLIALGGWGFGGGFGGNGTVGPMMVNNDVQRGFDQSAVISGINGVQNAVTSGFGDIQTALCGGFGTVNSNIANGFAQAEIGANARQMADMQQQFALQSQLSSCCCENRMATVQTQNIVQAEGAATRSAIQNGVQAVLDRICADKIDAKNEKIVELNNRINSLEANNYIQNALTAQTQYFLQQYPPTAAARTAA